MCILLANLACGFLLGSALARTRSGAGILREIQSSLMQSSSVELWEEARRLPNAEEAAPLMEHLAGRMQDQAYAARAALWLGHYYYGAGQIEEALQHFVLTGSKGDNPVFETEGAFWAAQCRNLLGLPGDPSALEADTESQSGLFRRLAELDGQLRIGDLDGALGGYLALEGQARRVRSLAPLYYRLGLVIEAGGGRGVFDASLMQGWVSSVSRSVERALVGVFNDPATELRVHELSEAPGFTEPSSDLPPRIER